MLRGGVSLKAMINVVGPDVCALYPFAFAVLNEHKCPIMGKQLLLGPASTRIITPLGSVTRSLSNRENGHRALCAARAFSAIRGQGNYSSVGPIHFRRLTCHATSVPCEPAS